MSGQTEEKIYKIGQAAKLVGLKSYVLRFWEGEFEQLEPIRTPSGQRLYDDGHITLIRRLKTLLHDEGLTIEGARKRLDSYNKESGQALACQTPDSAPEVAEQLSLFNGDRVVADSAEKSILKDIHAELLVLKDLLS
ncbi:MerR family transcriptional regulator [Maridesulfovibrio hydrothermalis]|uniref:Transcriptional regulator, MerR family n=1 Tax=Maridesulfovibrio hydrothermalis AM13 = DSM 14728 TaxID=1121451 RepID=L0RF63_9BACT|nr:MerR family transcriptional regulator [Maridesulfovibrio hydrothermalis]CCO25394.1 Transcriptional regulator, MerR family [Maridesulfovibrio hydrothermalis AM13 = DSM 14728]